MPLVGLQFFEKFEAPTRVRERPVDPDEEDEAGGDFGLADMDLDQDAQPSHKYMKQLVGLRVAKLEWT